MFKFFNNFINRFDASASNHIANTKNPSNLNGSNLEYNFALGKEVDSSTTNKDKKIYSNIDVNLEYVNARFNTLINSDIIIREFLINVKAKQFKAFIIYVDGMSDKASINDFVLKPLMLKNYSNQYDGDQIVSEAVANNIMIRKIKKFNIVDYVSDSLLPQNDVKKINSFDQVASDVVAGNCVLFIDTVNICFDIDVKKFDTRSIAEPKNEPVIMGSQEAFVENWL